MTIDDLEPQKWKITAFAPGFQTFNQDIAFADGKPDLAIKVDLNAVSSAPPPPRGVPVAAAPPPRPAKDSDSGDDDGKIDVPSGTGLLNINSLPPSKVLLDGRAMGGTPKTDVSVPAGTHTVTFIHPDLGKKTVSVDVKPGQRAVASVRFDK
jgi:serine/threonine-protein kinase